MKKYEIMYILRAELSEEERNAEMENIHKVIVDNGGTIVNVDTEKLGLREFAYPIKDQLKGYYVIIDAEVGNETLAEFDRLTKLNARVLRHIIVAK